MSSDVETSLSEIAMRVQKGDVSAVARACRLIDERSPHRLVLLQKLQAGSEQGHVIGITGPAGTGKSSLANRLIALWRAQGLKVAVLAVDPTSGFTGGAILGDRIRMQEHTLDDGVFIRSIATRGQVGGLSQSTAEQLRVVRAAGFERIIVETVGVGQDELDVARLVDTVIVITAPGLGDGVQAIKAGILEIADLFVVNKADRPGADIAAQHLQQMIALSDMKASAPGEGHSAANVRQAHAESGRSGDGSWSTPVLLTSAEQNQGVQELARLCDEHKKFLAASDIGERRVQERRRFELQHALQVEWNQLLWSHFGEKIGALVSKAERGEVGTYDALQNLLQEAQKWVVDVGKKAQ